MDLNVAKKPKVQGEPPVATGADFGTEAMDCARKLLGSEEVLCAECMGRVFGKIWHGLGNPERFVRISSAVGMDARALDDKARCIICHGAFANIPHWVDRAVAASEGYEWHTFLCGSRWEPSHLAMEESIWVRFGSSWGESVRTAFNREYGKEVSKRTGREARMSGQDVLFVADIPAGRVEFTPFSIYFSGRYRKLDRTIPQTRWPCRECRGRGCKRCGGTGKMYETSVEELVAGPLMSLAGGTEHRFHGMGREDIDARMLGNGRPFVAEVLLPHRRSLPLKEAEELIRKGAEGRVEVIGLKPCVAGEIQRVKQEAHDKSYRVVVKGNVTEEKIIEAVNSLVGRNLAQRTPVRVAHRRADLVRSRGIKEMKVTEHAGETFTVELRAEAGTYVKEFVTGDEGRTVPSLSSTLGTPLQVVSLDVIAVHDAEGN